MVTAMTGPEHFAAAEEALESGLRGLRQRDPTAKDFISIAQVHATLALAMATALGRTSSSPAQDWIRASKGDDADGLLPEGQAVRA